MPTITGSHIIKSIPGIAFPQGRYERIMSMIDAASDLLGDGEAHEIGDNPEYERGVAELICAVGDIPRSHKGNVIDEIQHQAYVKREAALKRAAN